MNTPTELADNQEGLVGQSHADLAGKISTAALIRMWTSSYKLDVRRFFPAPEVELKLVPPYNYYRFQPVLSGDATFYSLLMRRMGYERSEKAEFTEARRHISSTDKVLDVGCGTGNFADRCPGIYCGIDTNPTAVEDAVKLGRNVKFGLVEEQEPESYDIVTMFQVLEHVDSPKEFLQVCTRCLKPGGLLIVSTPNMNGFMGSVPNDVLNYPPHHMSWWSEGSLRALASDCGCEPTGTWLEPLRREHLRGALWALIRPRDQRHLDTSLTSFLLSNALRVVARLASRQWSQAPFVAGHTVMIVAKKRPGQEIQ